MTVLPETSNTIPQQFNHASSSQIAHTFMFSHFEIKAPSENNTIWHAIATVAMHETKFLSIISTNGNANL